MNREAAAAVTATNTGLMVVFAVLLFALVSNSELGEPAPLPAPLASAVPPVDEGWEIYSAERCSSCHSIAGQGSPRYPLDGVGARLDRNELRLWIVAPRQMRPDVRKRSFDHLSDEEVDALVDLLEALSGS